MDGWESKCHDISMFAFIGILSIQRLRRTSALLVPSLLPLFLLCSVLAYHLFQKDLTSNTKCDNKTMTLLPQQEQLCNVSIASTLCRIFALRLSRLRILMKAKSQGDIAASRCQDWCFLGLGKVNQPMVCSMPHVTCHLAFLLPNLFHVSSLGLENSLEHLNGDHLHATKVALNWCINV